MDLESIKKKLNKELGAKRYTHTLGVMDTAMLLASCYGISIQKAQLAGLLHDCAKKMKEKDSISLCEACHVEITDVEKRNVFLLHAKAGAELAKRKYHVKDEEILSAIRCHTTGKPDMTILDKIIFIADYIEPNRSHSDRLPYLRKLAFQDLDETLIQILQDTLFYLEKKGNEIDPMTKKTYDYYIKERN
ncbi:MAG: HD domain-containing protein [Lachnospiraceae bacterium]|nr:HD domain-containing protein [Lachnospiraceae bacterium]